MRKEKFTEEKIDDIIKSLEKGFGDSDADQAKTLQLFKGIVFSKDPKAKEYLSKLDKATTQISKEMSESFSFEKIEVPKSFRIPGTDIVVEEGQSIVIKTPLKEDTGMENLYRKMLASSYFESEDYDKQRGILFVKWEGAVELLISRPVNPDTKEAFAVTRLSDEGDENEVGFNDLADLVRKIESGAINMK